MDPIYSYIIWVLVLNKLLLRRNLNCISGFCTRPQNAPNAHEASAGYTSADLAIGDDDFKIVVLQGAIGVTRYMGVS